MEALPKTSISRYLLLIVRFKHVLIPKQAGFRPGKSCTAQVLNLIQHVEDGFETGKITGIVLVDLSAAYDTVNHRRLLEKVYNMTRDYRLMCMIRTLLESRRFFVELGGKRSRWRSQRNGLPQGSVLSSECPRTTSLQRIHKRPAYSPGHSQLCVCRRPCCHYTEHRLCTDRETLTSALDVSLFHLRNRECGKQLNISWNGVNLTHCKLPVYLGEHCRIKHISRRPKRKSEQETTSSTN